MGSARGIRPTSDPGLGSRSTGKRNVEFLGRRKSERRVWVDACGGYRNGHRNPPRLSMMAGTIELRRPRARGLEQRFEGRILPLFGGA